MRRLTLAAGIGVLFLAACSDLLEPPTAEDRLAPDDVRASHIGTPTLAGKLLASDGAAGDFFGYSVAVSGDMAIIGAAADDDAGFDSGSAYVFERSGGTWAQVAKLTAADAAFGDVFGYSVAVSEDVAVIGAAGDDDAGTSSGSAYVFERSGGAWTQVAKLTAADAAAGDLFGVSVAVSEDVAVIGSVGDDDAGTSSGSAYVFERGTWSQVAKLTASDAAANDFFGFSVAISGDVVVIGSVGDGDGAGSAYVFERGTWSEVAKLTPGDAAAGDLFGVSVAVSEDVAVIGSVGDDDAGTSSGSAYVFERGTWSQVAKLTASDANAVDQFGWSVAVSGDVAVIGAFTTDQGGSASGSAYVFEHSGGAWSQVAKLTAADAAAGDLFGRSVAVSEGVAVIGAIGDDDAGSDSGSAYVFSLFDPNQPPAADAGTDQTVECTDADDGTTTVTLDGTGSSDADGTIVSYEWSIGATVIATGENPTVELSHGTHTVTLTVTDDGGATATDEVVIDIVDTLAPSIDFALSQTELSPPNGEMITVATGIAATDLCDPSPVVSVDVTSNEPVTGPGDDTFPDWVITDNGDGTFDVAVRAERLGRGEGRVYTITVTATDAAGNADTVSGEVTVPRNPGRRGPPDGRGRPPR